MRGEQGGTTGVLDREIGEKGGERKRQARSHMHRHGSTQETQSENTANMRRLEDKASIIVSPIIVHSLKRIGQDT